MALVIIAAASATVGLSTATRRRTAVPTPSFPTGPPTSFPPGPNPYIGPTSPPFWTTPTGIGTIVGVSGGVFAIIVIVVVVACKRRTDESKWRDPRRYTIDTSLDEA
jgi:hypothetical protein